LEPQEIEIDFKSDILTMTKKFDNFVNKAKKEKDLYKFKVKRYAA
jgi:hypothetical protein